MSRTRKPYVSVAVRQKREAAIARVRCHGGHHQMTPTFRAGEQVCLSCGAVQYCPTCLDAYQLPPSKSTRAFRCPCERHQGTAATQPEEVQA